MKTIVLIIYCAHNLQFTIFTTLQHFEPTPEPT